MALDLTDPARLLTDRRARTRLRAAGRILLGEAGHDDGELALALVDDDEMKRLNREYRGVDKTTDVLSFSQIDGVAVAACEAVHLGDVAISVPTARRQAAAGGWTLEEEMLRLLVHGFLHLLGYDHEAGRGEAARMLTEESRLFDVLAARGYACARRDPP